MSTRPIDTTEEEQDTPVVLESSAVSRIESAQINQQVATAKQYPRSIKKFLQNSEAMATLNEDIAEECYYKLKREDKKTGEIKYIEGPSVRLLEICALNYCNLYYGATIIGEDGDYIVARGVAWDLENNVRSTLDVRRRITTKTGHKFSTDMMAMTANAASSIAKRNALNGIVPRVYVNDLMERAKAIVMKNAKPLAERIQRCFKKFESLNVTPDQLLKKVGVDHVSKLTAEHLELLYGTFTAIRDNDSSIEEEFPVDKPVQSNAPNFVGNPATTQKPAENPPVDKPKKTKEPVAEKAPEPAATTQPPSDAPQNTVPFPAADKPADAPDQTPPPQPTEAPKNEPSMFHQLEAKAKEANITVKDIEDYCRNSTPPLLAQEKTLSESSESKLKYIMGTGIWKTIVKGINKV